MEEEAQTRIQKPFEGMIDNLIIVKEQYEVLEKVVVSISKALGIEVLEANKYLKTLTKLQDMTHL